MKARDQRVSLMNEVQHLSQFGAWWLMSHMQILGGIRMLKVIEVHYTMGI